MLLSGAGAKESELVTWHGWVHSLNAWAGCDWPRLLGAACSRGKPGGSAAGGQGLRLCYGTQMCSPAPKLLGGTASLLRFLEESHPHPHVVYSLDVSVGITDPLGFGFTVLHY